MSHTAVLHAGYALVLVLLAVSVYEVFRLQSANAQTRISVYERFLAREEARSTVRRTLWLASNSVRDYFLSQDRDRLARYRHTLAEINRSAEQALEAVAKLDGQRAGRLGLAGKVRGYIGELTTLRHPLDGPEEPAVEQLRRLTPRRLAAMKALEDASRESQHEVRLQLDEIAQHRVRTFRKLYLFFGVMFAVGVAIAWVTNRYAKRVENERQAHAAETAAAREELRRLSARLQELQEEERRALARELHDEVGQALTALRMEISHSHDRVNESEPRARLDRAKRLAEQCVRTVRNISLMLRPSILDDLGLAAALQWQLEELGRRGHIETAFTSSGDQEALLPDALNTCIFRVAQEALNNCEKYALASEVRVDLAIANNLLRLEIRDNGVGFQLNEKMLPPRGTGILGMRERVERLQGDFRVDSRPGEGTRITVELPVPVSPAAPLKESAA